VWPAIILLLKNAALRNSLRMASIIRSSFYGYVRCALEVTCLYKLFHTQDATIRNNILDKFLGNFPWQDFSPDISLFSRQVEYCLQL